MAIACASDDRFAPICATMLHSLFTRNPGERIAVHYLCPPEFSTASQDKLRQLVESAGGEILFHVMRDELVQGLPPMRGIQRIIWYRVFLPLLLQDTERVLYLDADTLVVEPLRPLWETSLERVPLAAIPNTIHPDRRRAQQEALGLPESAVYFNSGVMLMNLPVLRAMNATERVLACGRRSDLKLVWGDQDALNAVLAAHYQPLHPRWNCQASLYFWPAARCMFGSTVVDEAIRRPAILHFGGSDDGRPWHYLCQHPERNHYLEHLRQTPWRDYPLQGRTLKNVLHKHFRAVLRQLRG